MSVGPSPGVVTSVPRPAPASRALPEASFGYRMVLVLWVLFLFEPLRLITVYLPFLAPLKWIPELLLYGTVLVWLASPLPKRHVRWFTVFFGLTILGTVLAFFTGNWGIARAIVRQLFQYYGLGLLTLTFCNTPPRVYTVLLLYFLNFVYYGLWGLISLMTTPIMDEIDPGIRQIVSWHIHFNNRDGFGPLMVIGLAYCIHFRNAVRTAAMKNLALIAVLLCILGILTSFGRGVFLALIVTVAYMWIHAKRKIVSVFVILVSVVLFLVTTPEFADRYLSTMETILSEGTTQGTGRDRKVLWGWAWREFVNRPVFGVGTGNFGIAVFTFVDNQEVRRAGYTRGRLWGRALHSAPMTVLSEYGTVGAAVMILLVVDFFGTNRRAWRIGAALTAPSTGPPSVLAPKTIVSVAVGMRTAFMGICVAAFFYEILYTPLIWHLVVLNQLLYIAAVRAQSAAAAEPQKAPSASAPVFRPVPAGLEV